MEATDGVEKDANAIKNRGDLLGIEPGSMPRLLAWAREVVDSCAMASPLGLATIPLLAAVPRVYPSPLLLQG